MFTAKQILTNLWKTAPNVDNTSRINGNYVYRTFVKDGFACALAYAKPSYVLFVFY